ncbi:phage tail fiber protein [Hafnia alvei]|uniref:phage tail fiber protein n=1 Tax=Hafnia alvei TaxID=569 RepID=UPI00103541DA|nr:phage tail protein [Hafnia alvei]TBM28149.1 phage tail protein [Hafnia alvei]TBM28447.1 phage tail protein [Hafnia alvei]TBM28502.1 phage tail protein [Hafnia alvei]TBM30062.1 phage tail protein [Hafnia alvei]
MSAGTITLTHNSAAVTGAGTAFTTDLKAGDIIASVVGGVTYTLPVKTVNSAASVTLIKNYDGPTQAGAAWYAIPRDAMNAITAQLAADTAQALRGLNYDKQNWQQVFSGTGTITVRLPDGSSYTGPAWNSFIVELGKKANAGDNSDITSISGLKTALSIAQGGTGEKTPGMKLLGGLGLKSNSRFLTTTGSYIPGEFVPQAVYDSRSIVGYANIHNWPLGISAGVQSGANGTDQSGVISLLTVRGWPDDSGISASCQWFMGATKAGYRYPGYNSVDAAWYLRTEYLWCTRTTTVDSNGFIKKASPVIKIFSDGKFETNNESEGAQVTREGVGVYRISNILGPHSDKAWGGIDGGFEIPKDRNGQRLLWLDYEVDADGSILVKTYHRTYPEAPAFARNIKDGYEESDPIDIPSDQFLSVRVEMPQDSIWNLAQKAAQEEMAREEIAEE